MPPKKGKKGKKGKAGKVNPFMLLDSAPIQDMSKDQLWDFALRIQEELETVRKEKSLFQLERNKTQTVWETTKKNLEESEVELRSTTAERSEVDEQHREEMTVSLPPIHWSCCSPGPILTVSGFQVYKQKMKHVLTEQHNAVSEVKTDAVTSRSLQQKQNTDLELDLRRQLRDLQMDNKEKRLQEHSSIKMLKLNHQRELMRLGGEFERRMQVLEVQKLVTTRSLAEMFQRKLMNALTEIDTFRKCHLVSLNKEHDSRRERTEGTFEEYLDTKHYEQHTWKGELKKLQNQKLRWEKKISAAQQENQRLKTTLQEVQQKLPELHRRLQEHQHSKQRMEEYRAQQKLVDQELRDLTVEHELLLQAFHKVQQERDELLRRQTQSILDVQQRSGLKKILLQRKMEALSQTLEKKEAQLSAALSVCSVEPTARSNAAHKLQEILESKRTAMEALQLDLDQGAQEYDQLLRSLKGDLEAAGILPFQFPFKATQKVLEEVRPDLKAQLDRHQKDVSK
ncbi:LOW QUALITY PROTEIN: dynein regulatory complex subunit 4-like [Xiphophorus hellerii]|uniref:LOW QUALITY PROTEIN: dynein regulatory complex subunit 4-like n=1 Tax=Xiphophorus hellerii TaxID=8084 RepID=UPI0013B41849|nr:LOW QUALITY PROTEIN: dynein regulatory complex subunit 4-like [Xiphophorus hellerii]